MSLVYYFFGTQCIYVEIYVVSVRFREHARRRLKSWRRRWSGKYRGTLGEILGKSV